MRKSVLVIVDMQTGFDDAAMHVLQENLDAIEIAKKKRMFIVVLEFGGNGKTLKPIQESLDEYHSIIYKRKYMCDGSKHVGEALVEKDISPVRFFVTGVYADACVFETVRGLASKFDPVPVAVVDKAVANLMKPGFKRGCLKAKNVKVQKGKIGKRTFVLSGT